MKPFQVLSPGAFLDPTGIGIVIQSFSQLYHTVTPKHKKMLRLTIIEESENRLSLRKQLEQFEIVNAVRIIDREHVDTVTTAYREASIFFYPSEKTAYKIISEALTFGIPLLTSENTDTKMVLDHSCGLMVRIRNEDQASEAFGKMLEMLYFDPEVRKILEKGAQFKNSEELRWSSGQKQSVL